MTRKTRKKRSSRKKTQSHTRKLGGKQISLLGNNADLNQVIRKLNDVIMLCCHEGSVKQTESESPGRVLPGLDPRMLNFSPASSTKKKAMPRRSKRLAMKMVKAEHKQSPKKRGKNEFFKKMLAAKAAKASSFEYKGKIYKASKRGKTGQLIVYKKAN